MTAQEKLKLFEDIDQLMTPEQQLEFAVETITNSLPKVVISNLSGSQYKYDELCSAIADIRVAMEVFDNIGCLPDDVDIKYKENLMKFGKEMEKFGTLT